jgi:hypothetical protein
MIAAKAFTVRLRTAAGKPAGLGALVTESQILTCAHVVNAALGLPPNAQDKPTGPSPSTSRCSQGRRAFGRG